MSLVGLRICRYNAPPRDGRRTDWSASRRLWLKMREKMSHLPINVPRLADAIVRELEASILDGVYKPGDRLPPERQLADEFGVSRASLREAIKQLSARGMVDSRQGGGTFVTDRLERSFSGPWEELLGQHVDLRDDVLEFRRMLEGEVAALAAVRATDADRTRLAQLFAELEASYATGDLVLQSTADVAFHSALADAAHNVLLAHLTTSLLGMLQSNIHDNIANLFNIKPVASDLLAQHRAIWHAIDGRDPARARAAAETHLDFVANTLAAMRVEARRVERATRRLAAQ